MNQALSPALFAPDPRRCHQQVAPIRLPERVHQRLEDKQYLAMDRMFSMTGGMFVGDDLIRRLRHTTDQPISMLARWIVGRQVVTFEWQRRLMAPMFQFELMHMTVRPAVTRVLEELAEVFDDWSLALWFAQPNSWLDGAAPAYIIGSDAEAVHAAARADRYIALG